MGKSEHTRQEDDLYLTPSEVFEPLIMGLGDIGLDPSSNPRAVVPAWTYYMLPQFKTTSLLKRAEAGEVVFGNGLELPWDGRGLVFCNPPYSELGLWLKKAAQEGDEVVLLVPVRTSANYWHDWAWPADAICFWKGRIKHHGMEHGAPFHQCLIYWGERRQLFAEAFEALGHHVRYGKVTA